MLLEIVRPRALAAAVWMHSSWTLASCALLVGCAVNASRAQPVRLPDASSHRREEGISVNRAARSASAETHGSAREPIVVTPRASSRATSSYASAEPRVGDVVRMVLAAGRGLSVERVASLARRARLTGLVPQLRISAERGLQQDSSSSTTVRSQSDRTAIADDLRLAATLSFELDRLVFSPDEVRLLSVERWLAADQRKLVGEAVKLYFQRRRLLRERASSHAPDGELDDSLAEVEALLDGLTAGGFGVALGRSP